MYSLKKKTAAIALTAGLALAVTGCAEDDVTGATDVTQDAEPVAQIDSLDGKQTAVILDQGFLDGLTSLKLTPATLGGATLDGGKIAFPISGGDVTYYDPSSDVEPFVQGEIQHDGSGLSLTDPNGKVVELTDFVVDPGESELTGKVTVDGEVFAESAPLFFLDGSTLEPLQVNEGEGTAVLAGTTVSLTKTAADALNMVFGTDALAEFFKVGVAEITLELPES